MGKIKISILDPFECISDNNEEKIVSYLSSLFGDTEGKRLKRIGNSPSRISSVGGLLALSFCVGGKKADIFRGENGKPYFFDSPDFCDIMGRSMDMTAIVNVKIFIFSPPISAEIIVGEISFGVVYHFVKELFSITQ